MAELAELVDLVLVVGAKNSSNSNRLRGDSLGPRRTDLSGRGSRRPCGRNGWRACETVGVTAGASAPEDLVQGLIEALRVHGATEVTTLPGVPEDLHFKLPPQLVS